MESVFWSKNPFPATIKSKCKWECLRSITWFFSVWNYVNSPLSKIPKREWWYRHHVKHPVHKDRGNKSSSICCYSALVTFQTDLLPFLIFGKVLETRVTVFWDLGIIIWVMLYFWWSMFFCLSIDLYLLTASYGLEDFCLHMISIYLSSSW